MALNFFRKKALMDGIWAGNYMDTKVLYVFQFNQLPNISLILQIDSGKAFQYIKEHLAVDITDVYQFTQFNHSEQELFFNMTVIVLKNRRLIELGPDYAVLLHGNKDYAWVDNLMSVFAGFKMADTPTSPPTIGFTVSTAIN